MRLAILLMLFPGLALAATPEELLHALDIADEDVIDATGQWLEQQGVVRSSLGPITPVSEPMALVTTGVAAQVETGLDHDLGHGGADPLDPGATVYDQALMNLTLQVPEGIHSFLFDWFFLSREYPYYVGSEFNDRFTVIQEGLEYTGNIVFDSEENVVDVNNALFTVVDASSLTGTGFWRPADGTPNAYDGGGTGWVTTRSPVAPGEIITLRFDIHDLADGIYDSGVLLDNFRWSEAEVDDPVSVVRPELHYLTPKSGPVAGGNAVTLIGRGFTTASRVWFGELAVPPEQVELLDNEALLVTVPPSVSGPGLTDVTVQVDDDGELLRGGYTWAVRSTDGAPPALITLDPVEGLERGGEPLTLLGERFTEDTRVLFGETPAQGVTWVSDTELEVIAPALDAGPWVVRTTTQAGRFEGTPQIFFSRGELPPPVVAGTTASGCEANVGGGAGGLLALLGFGLLVRRRRGALLTLLLVGCGSDNGLGTAVFDAPIAEARILAQATEPDAEGPLPGRRAASTSLIAPLRIDGSFSYGFGGTSLTWDWSILEAPEGSEAELEGEDAERSSVTLSPDVAGTYLVQLVVQDHRGRRSHASGVVVQAVPSESLRVLLDWNDGGHDLDLHLIRPDGQWFDAGDCFYGRPNPSWGSPDLTSDDPRISVDADGGQDQRLEEDITLPETDPGTYQVLVHHVNDRGDERTIAARLELWVAGERVEVDVPEGELGEGEVWRALTITMPGGLANPIDQLTTHEALGGPPLNQREPLDVAAFE